MRLKSLAFFSGLLALAAAFLLPAASADAATISTSNAIVVLRVGDGTTTLSGNTAAVFLEEYAITYTGGAPTGATHVQTIAVPNTGTGNTKLTIGGTAGLEGGLSLSANGQYLMFTGYNQLVGAGASTSSARRMVARVNMAGNVELDAVYGTNTVSANNAFRGVTSLTGDEYWLATTNANTGVSYRPWAGGDDSTVTSSLLNGLNARRVEIFNPGSGNQLYVDSAAGSVFGVATVGSGTPTSGSQTVALLPGMPTTTGPSPVDFFFANADTLYVADDRTSTSGGLQKWVFDSDSGNWGLAYTLNVNPTGSTVANGMRGLTGSVDAGGNVILFGTTTYGTTAAANFLVGISDTLSNTNAANVTVNSLASSASIPGAGGSLATFRGLEAIGVEIPIVIPEPGSLGLLAIGGLLMMGARRRKP